MTDKQDEQTMSELDFCSLTPSEIAYSTESVLAEAERISQLCVNNIPALASPGQARALLSNYQQVYAVASNILTRVLADKKPELAPVMH